MFMFISNTSRNYQYISGLFSTQHPNWTPYHFGRFWLINIEFNCQLHPKQRGWEPKPSQQVEVGSHNSTSMWKPFWHATILVGSPASLQWLFVILIALCSIKSPISRLHKLDNKGFCCGYSLNNYNNFGESIEENPTCVIMYTNWVVPPPSEWRPQTSQSSGMPFTFNFYILMGGNNPIYYINHRQSLTTQSIS